MSGFIIDSSFLEKNDLVQGDENICFV